MYISFTFYKQVDGCAMDGPFSVTSLSDICMAKVEDDIVQKLQPKF